MLQQVNVGHKSLADYATIAGRRLMGEIRRWQSRSPGKRVLHLSATAFGGGVAEINYTLLPLMIDAGLQAEWRVIWGQEEFFQVTKTIHNALQGSPESLDEEQRRIFDDYNRRNAEALEEVRLRHRPRPAACRRGCSSTRRDARTGSGAATSTSRRRTGRARLPRPMVARYDATIFHRPVRSRRRRLPTAYIWPPAIDPSRRRTWRSRPRTPRYIVDQFGIDVDRPLLTQVSRFDPWKDPLGVIEAYRLVREQRPTSSSRSSARWPTTTRRAGSSTTRPSRRRTATRTSTSSRT